MRARRKVNQGRGPGFVHICVLASVGGVGLGLVFKTVLREGLNTKVIFKSRSAGGSEPCEYRDKSNPGRGKGKCKDPELGCLRCSRKNKKEAGVNDIS